MNTEEYLTKLNGVVSWTALALGMEAMYEITQNTMWLYGGAGALIIGAYWIGIFIKPYIKGV